MGRTPPDLPLVRGGACVSFSLGIRLSGPSPYQGEARRGSSSMGFHRRASPCPKMTGHYCLTGGLEEPHLFLS